MMIAASVNCTMNKLNPASSNFQDQSDENIASNRLQVFYPWKSNKSSESSDKREVVYHSGSTSTGLNNGQSMPSSNSSSSPCTSPISSNNSITSLIQNANAAPFVTNSQQPHYYMNQQQHDYQLYMQSNQHQQSGHLLPSQYTDRHFLNKALMEGYPQVDSFNSPNGSLAQNTWWEQQGVNVAAPNLNPSHNFTNFTPPAFSHESAANYEANHVQMSQHHFSSNQHIDYHHQPYSQLFTSTSPASTVMAAYHHHMSKNLSSKSLL
jgi:hypothetical protein